MSTIFTFFADELTKEGSDYYQRNRHKILARQRAYRQKNKSSIARRQRVYRRRVKSGAKRQRARQRVGNSYIYTGIK